MGLYDFRRFNGYAREGLEEHLTGDLLHHDIFNERDMHAAAYYYIRTYFRRAERDSVYVRCEPNLGGKKPDIVIYEEGDPIYVLEFKFYPKPDSVNEDTMLTDLDKLSTFMKRFPSVRWGFFHMIYDADTPYRLSDAKLRRWGFGRISATTINARRHTVSEIRRKDYDEWRARFDQLQDAHREHA